MHFEDKGRYRYNMVIFFLQDIQNRRLTAHP